MKQQINLYKFLPTQAFFRFNQRMVLSCYGIFLFLLIIHFLFSLWHSHQQTLLLKQLNARHTQQKQALANLFVEYPFLSGKDLQSSLQDLQQQLTIRAKVFFMLSQKTGLSRRLVGLSEGIAPSVWLSEIHISNIEQVILLNGYALQTIPIQQSLDQFSRTAVFNGVLFGLQELTQVTTEKNYTYLSFRAISKPMVTS